MTQRGSDAMHAGTWVAVPCVRGTQRNDYCYNGGGRGAVFDPLAMRRREPKRQPVGRRSSIPRSRSTPWAARSMMWRSPTNDAAIAGGSADTGGRWRQWPSSPRTRRDPPRSNGCAARCRRNRARTLYCSSRPAAWLSGSPGRVRGCRDGGCGAGSLPPQRAPRR